MSDYLDENGAPSPKAPSPEEANDDAIRDEFVRLITFVAKAKASNAMKEDALDAIQSLQSRLLP